MDRAKQLKLVKVGQVVRQLGLRDKFKEELALSCSGLLRKDT